MPPVPVPVPFPLDEELEFPELEPEPDAPLPPPPLDCAKAAMGNMMQIAQAVVRKNFLVISIS
ncbi:hypothetical protein GCM10007874_40010 [Labrys miyagiensis]|uniref:Uncharacterized protein n=1 Tax=Labrys miyagiensis TaxID=346912 RepID=A0ABQ6CQK5_9HYPH|nr:hypothetical protein GCM10007874_40010 [Labrys miyagiensis]